MYAQDVFGATEAGKTSLYTFLSRGTRPIPYLFLRSCYLFLVLLRLGISLLNMSSTLRFICYSPVMPRKVEAEDESEMWLADYVLEVYLFCKGVQAGIIPAYSDGYSQHRKWERGEDSAKD